MFRRIAIMLVSSMHHQKTSDTSKDLPEIISFYNSLKGGVDSLDEKCTKYTCSRRSRRWPLVIFYRILDIAAANSFIMSSYPTPNRLGLMKNLNKSLVTPCLDRRYALPQLPHELKSLIGRILEKDLVAEMQEIRTENDTFVSLKNCYICPVGLQCSKPTCSNCC